MKHWCQPGSSGFTGTAMLPGRRDGLIQMQGKPGFLVSVLQPQPTIGTCNCLGFIFFLLRINSLVHSPLLFIVVSPQLLFENFVAIYLIFLKILLTLLRIKAEFIFERLSFPSFPFPVVELIRGWRHFWQSYFKQVDVRQGPAQHLPLQTGRWSGELLWHQDILALQKTLTFLTYDPE